MSGIDQYQSSGEYSTFASGHQGILPNPSGFEGYFPIPPCHACAIVPIIIFDLFEPILGQFVTLYGQNTDKFVIQYS